MNFIILFFIFFTKYVNSIPTGLLKEGAKPIIHVHREPIDEEDAKLDFMTNLKHKIIRFSNVVNKVSIKKRAYIPISYHGGRTMKHANVYTIYYGDWQYNNIEATSLISYFFNNIDKTDYWNIQKQYTGESTVIEKKIIFDNYSLGKAFPNVEEIIKNAIIKGNLPTDPDGVYFVITSKDVSIAGFCKHFCGYHTYFQLNETRIIYSFVGDSTTCWGCSPIRESINNNVAADTSMSIIAHELVESMSDPYLDAWFDSEGYENKDKCAWNYGDTYVLNNKKYNLKMPKYRFLIQTNFDRIKNTCSNDIKLPTKKTTTTSNPRTTTTSKPRTTTTSKPRPTTTSKPRPTTTSKPRKTTTSKSRTTTTSKPK